MIGRHESTLPKLRVKLSLRKDDAPVQRGATPSTQRRVVVAQKGPTFLNAYVIPVLLLNLAIVGWTLIAAHVVQGLMVYLGYALIVTVGLRLYLAYLDCYDSSR